MYVVPHISIVTDLSLVKDSTLTVFPIFITPLLSTANFVTPQTCASIRFLAPDPVEDSVIFSKSHVYQPVLDCCIVAFTSTQVDIQDAIVLSKFTCKCDQLDRCVGLFGLVICIAGAVALFSIIDTHQVNKSLQAFLTAICNCLVVPLQPDQVCIYATFPLQNILNLSGLVTWSDVLYSAIPVLVLACVSVWVGAVVKRPCLPVESITTKLDPQLCQSCKRFNQDQTDERVGLINRPVNQAVDDCATFGSILTNVVLFDDCELDVVVENTLINTMSVALFSAVVIFHNINGQFHPLAIVRLVALPPVQDCAEIISDLDDDDQPHCNCKRALFELQYKTSLSKFVVWSAVLYMAIQAFAVLARVIGCVGSCVSNQKYQALVTAALLDHQTCQSCSNLRPDPVLVSLGLMTSIV